MKKFLCLIFVLLCLSGCGKAEQYWTVEEESAFSYSYEIRDKQGNVLLSDSGASRQPHIEALDSNTVKLMIQGGTGLSTQSTKYCDIENGIVSDWYSSVLCEHDGNTVFAERRDDGQYIVICSIFDENGFYKEYKIDGISECADPVLKAELSVTKLNITYLAGENYIETETSIDISE